MSMHYHEKHRCSKLLHYTVIISIRLLTFCLFNAMDSIRQSIKSPLCPCVQHFLSYLPSTFPLFFPLPHFPTPFPSPSPSLFPFLSPFFFSLPLPLLFTFHYPFPSPTLPPSLPLSLLFPLPFFLPLFLLPPLPISLFPFHSLFHSPSL